MKNNNLKKWCIINNKEYLLKEWDYKDNFQELKITPIDISPGSNKKVYWICEKGHIWQTRIYSRTKYNHKCIYCTGQKSLKGFNDFKKWCLDNNKNELLKEWDYERNLKQPYEYTKCSGQKVFWKCSKNHSWEATIAHRVTENTGCPICTNKKILKGYNDLKTLRPDISKQWHPTKNGNMKPEDFLVGSHYKVWWICENGHEWEASIESRTRKRNATSCAVCSKKRLYSGMNDLVTFCNNHTDFKYLLKEWDYKKNFIKPNEIVATSKKKVYWICSNNHEWTATVGSRVRGNNCPKCNPNTSFPEQAIFYYVSKTFINTISRYKFNKTELDIFIPELNVGIEYDGFYFHNSAMQREIIKNKICKDNNIRLIRIREKGLCIYDDCECIIRNTTNSDDSLNKVITKLLKLLNIEHDVNIKRDAMEIIKQYKIYLKNNSIELAYPNLVLEWDYEKNKGLKLINFTRGSHEKVYWKCSNCGYTWFAEIKSRVNGNGCKICGRQKAIKARSRKVLNIDTNLIYNSLTDAQRKTGIERHRISNCCKDKNKTAGGFHWKYIEK